MVIAVRQQPVLCLSSVPGRQFELGMGGAEPFRRDPIQISGRGMRRQQCSETVTRFHGKLIDRVGMKDAHRCLCRDGAQDIRE